MLNKQNTIFENIIKNSPMDNNDLFLHTSKKVREAGQKTTGWEMACREVASGFAGPMVFSFVWWVLFEADKKKIKRLYFFARDGLIFFKTAQILVKQWGIDVDVKYLYCSRESLFLPSFDSFSQFEKKWVTWGSLSRITIREIASRLEINILELKMLCSDKTVMYYLDHPQVDIQPRDRANMEAFLASSKVSKQIFISSQLKMHTTYEYLKQEGCCDRIDFGVVDTGWLCSSQFALSKILKKNNIRPSNGIYGFYLGVNNGAYTFENDSINGFLFDWRYSKKNELLNNFLCFEMVTSADHGRTRGYFFSENGEVEPDLSDLPENFPIEKIKLIHEITENYTLEMSKLVKLNEYGDVFARLIYKLSLRFITAPSSNIAELFCDWPIASEIKENDSQSIAPKMNLRLLFEYSTGMKKVKGFWPQASLIRGKLYIINNIYNLFLRLNLLDLYRKYIVKY